MERRNCPYQTDAGDAGVVGDVGDMEDLSFILAAGFGPCGEQEKSEIQVEHWK